MRNVAQISRRELEAHRVLVNGVTASVPAYVEADTAGNKEWVVDVYIGPLLGLSIIRNVPIIPAAKQLVTDVRQPVQLERSKQGKYTVVGRAKVMTAGMQTPEQSILEPTFREVEVNLAALKCEHIADLDYEVSPFQADPNEELQANEDEELQQISATDAFGVQVMGPDADEDASTELIELAPAVNAKTRHVRVDVATLGPPGDPLAMVWGTSALQPMVSEVIELED